MKHSIALISSLLLLAGAAAAARGDGAALDAFERTGETVSCVSMRSTDITPIDESRLLFRVGRSDYYLNETRNRCNDIDSKFTRIDVRLFGSQLCSMEILQIVDQQTGAFQGSCSLGAFEKLKKKPDAAASDAE